VRSSESLARVQQAAKNFVVDHGVSEVVLFGGSDFPFFRSQETKRVEGLTSASPRASTKYTIRASLWAVAVLARG